MKTCVYLDAVKRRLKIESDYALAAQLKTTRQAVSNYRAGRHCLDDLVAVRVAELLDLPPLQVLADIQCERAERAKKPAVKKLWESIAKAAAMTMVLISVGIPYFPADTTPAALKTPNLYYVKLLKWVKRCLKGCGAAPSLVYAQ